ncbi:isoaspartyl peptidase/L-asparaginase, partial [Klebsiella pneumoniae]|uniref:isoaspartyl peptidase/L-asparaginase n=1 Tax=Klebsiella pneumoniae TaxID=573 RepID=UPI00210CE7BE
PLFPEVPISRIDRDTTSRKGALEEHLAGGMTNKLPGRVGDSPLPGAGCYANNASVAVSCTGTGEVFMRTTALDVTVQAQILRLLRDRARASQMA